MAEELTRIDDTDVSKCVGFCYDGCHKIYVCRNIQDYHMMLGFGYNTLHPMNELEKRFDDSCPLRFISWSNLVEIVPQGAPEVTFHYGRKRHIVKFSD